MLYALVALVGLVLGAILHRFFMIRIMNDLSKGKHKYVVHLNLVRTEVSADNMHDAVCKLARWGIFPCKEYRFTIDATEKMQEPNRTSFWATWGDSDLITHINRMDVEEAQNSLTEILERDGSEVA